MKDVFLSYCYDDMNTRLAKEIEELLETHNLGAVTGDTLGGEIVTQEVLKQIEEADALITMLTRREQLTDGKWTTHQFCLTELQHARAKSKPAIALLEDGVTNAGPFQEHEYIKYTPNDPLPAFLKLSRTIWRWKRKVGRTLRIQLVPENVAKEIWTNRNGCRWQYRLSSGRAETDWQGATPRKEPGGLYLYVQVPDETMLIEVRINFGNRSWFTDATSFYMPLTLSEFKGQYGDSHSVTIE
jgi:hypothetical protein